MKKRIISIIISIGIMILLISFFKEARKDSLLIEDKNNRLIATQEINHIANNLQTILNLSMQYVDFFDLLIKNNPNISEETMESYCESIIKYNDIIDNISIAPNAVVNYIYPLEKNKEAMGHDLLADPERKEYIEMSIKTKEAVAQGPVESKQGGLKIFNRKAIFINDNGEEKFWGVAAIAVDFDKLLEKFNLSAEKDNYLYAIKVYNNNGNEDFRWGYDEIFDNDSIIKTIELPNEIWKIAIYPKNGWNNSEGIYKNIDYFACLILIAIFFVIYFYINHYQQIREAAKLDPLTGVNNKRYFEKYVKRKIKKSNKQHGLILIDLNKFKNINDTLGHPIGDKVLKETANRIKTILGDNDKLGRIGGDEFFLFVYDVKNKAMLCKMIDYIENRMKIPMDFGEHQIEVSCSIGLAVYNEDGKSYSELYKVADENMYENKKCSFR